MIRALTRPDESVPATLGGARRTIAWEAIDAEAVAPVDRAAIGERWKARHFQEHLAVGAFAQLAWGVAAHGGDPVVLGLLTRAASDEVRHAEICRRAAVAFLGEESVPARVSGAPRPPEHRGATSRERSLLHVVEMCCLSETFTGVYFTEALAATVDPTMRVVLESLLEDEIDHGRVGWAHLASVASREGAGDALARVSTALPAMLDRTVGRVLRGIATNAEEDLRSRRELGHLASSSCDGVFRQTLREVIFPGFEAVGVDLGPAHAAARDNAWL